MRNSTSGFGSERAAEIFVLLSPRRTISIALALVVLPQIIAARAGTEARNGKDTSALRGTLGINTTGSSLAGAIYFQAE